MKDEDFLDLAEAALTAMLKPTQQMIDAGDDRDPGHGDGRADAEAHYEAMIQSALYDIDVWR